MKNYNLGEFVEAAENHEGEMPGSNHEVHIERGSDAPDVLPLLEKLEAFAPEWTWSLQHVYSGTAVYAKLKNETVTRTISPLSR
jgi:hypothetical protein